MNITLEIPDDMSPQLARLQNPNAFILKALKTALDNKSATLADKEKSTAAPAKPPLKTLLASWTPLDEEFPEIEDRPPASEDIF